MNDQRLSVPWALLAALAILCPGASPCEAAGANLSGRQAPELTFPGGINGISAGEKLSQLRGDVVWLKFWVHNCPICLSTMPNTQARFERYRDFGLRVVTIVNKIEAARAQALMKAKRWTVPVALDPNGRLAARYRVKRRPTHYLIGTDGRVLVSNRISDHQIDRALGARRLQSIKPVPAGGAAAADAVRDGHTGTGLRLAKALGDAAFTARVRTAAEADLRAHAKRAGRWMHAGRASLAGKDLRILQTEYLHTALEKQAREARAAVLRRE